MFEFERSQRISDSKSFLGFRLSQGSHTMTKGSGIPLLYRLNRWGLPVHQVRRLRPSRETVAIRHRDSR